MELGILFAVLIASALAFIVAARRVARMISSLLQASNESPDVEAPAATDADVPAGDVAVAPSPAASEFSEAAQSAVKSIQEPAVVSSTTERPLRGDEIERLAEIEKALETHLKERARLVERLSATQGEGVTQAEVAGEEPASSRELVGDGLGPKQVFTEELKRVISSIMDGDDVDSNASTDVASEEAKQGLAEASGLAENSPIKKTVRKKTDKSH